jgi:hypothetical protein
MKDVANGPYNARGGLFADVAETKVGALGPHRMRQKTLG